MRSINKVEGKQNLAPKLFSLYFFLKEFDMNITYSQAIIDAAKAHFNLL